MIINTGKEQISTIYSDSRLQPEDSNCCVKDNGKDESSKVILNSIEKDSFTHQKTPISLNPSIIDSLLSKLTKQSNFVDLKQDILLFIDSISQIKESSELYNEIKSLLNNHTELKSYSIQDLKSLLSDIKEIMLKASVSNQFKFAELPINNLPEAIFEIGSFEKFIETLDLPEDIISKLTQFFQRNTDKYIRLVPFCNNSLAVLMSPEELQLDLSSFLQNLNSRQLKNLSVQSLETAIGSRLYIDLETLKSIDNLLTSSLTNWSNKRCGSESAQKSVITQWLLISLDNKNILPEMLSRFPSAITSAVSIIKDLSSILPQAENYGITEELFKSINKSDLIPEILDRLGYNYENALLTKHRLLNKNSLKAEILKYLSNSDSELIFGSSNLSLNNKTDFIPDKSELLNLTNQLQSRISVVSEELSRKVSSTSDLTSLISSFKKLESGFSNLMNFINNLNTNEHTSFENNSLNFTENQNTLISIVSSITDELNFINSFTNFNKSDTISDIFKNLFILMHKTTKSMDSISQINLNEVNNNRLADKDTFQPPVEKQSINELPVDNHTTKNLLENLLNKIESLQLLTKTTPVASDTNQQILVLPINIGGEWTEINLKLQKKYNSKKKNKNQNHFAVQIDLSPSKLGGISVKMEYEKKKILRIKVNIEKKETLEWFEKSHNLIKMSFNSLDLPFVNLEIKPMNLNINDENKNPTAAIDFKI